MQVTALASTYKTSSFFYLRALVRKSRDLCAGTPQQSETRFSSYSASFSYKSPLAHAKETQLILEEESASPDLAQREPAETAEHEVATTQPQSPGTQRVWGHRTAAVRGPQVEYTERRTEHQLPLHRGWSWSQTPCHTAPRSSSLCKIFPLQTRAWLVPAWEDLFLSILPPQFCQFCFSVSGSVWYFNRIWLIFCPQNQTTRCLLRASNSHW